MENTPDNEKDWASNLHSLSITVRATGLLPPCVSNNNYDCAFCDYNSGEYCDMLKNPDI
jgi:hypothetical protein